MRGGERMSYVWGCLWRPEGYQIPWNWSCRQLWATMWVVGAILFSVRAVSAPASRFLLFHKIPFHIWRKKGLSPLGGSSAVLVRCKRQVKGEECFSFCECCYHSALFISVTWVLYFLTLLFQFPGSGLGVGREDKWKFPLYLSPVQWLRWGLGEWGWKRERWS